MTSLFGFHRWGALALVAFIVTLPLPAQAQQGPIDLTWQAPQECPARSVVLDKVRRLLGTRAAPGSVLRAEGRITKARAGYRLELVLQGGAETGERKLAARRCADLAGAAAVALALLYSDAVAEESQPVPAKDTETTEKTKNSRRASDGAGTAQTKQSPDSAGTEERTPSIADADADGERANRVEPTRAQEGSSQYRVLVDIPYGTARFGPSPNRGLGLGVGAGVGVATENWSLRLLAQVSRSERLVVEERPEYGADVRFASAGLLGCRDVHVGAFGVSGCLAFALQLVRAEGYGRFIEPRPRTGIWPSAGLAALAFWQPFELFAVLVGGGAELHFARPRVTLEEVGLVRELSSTSAAIFVIPEWRF